jgi:signal transduction protein with GAF and PtsI domain
MKHERSRPKARTQSLDQRLAEDPYLTERMHQIADMRDELLAQGCSLDEVESKVVEQMRLLGKELLGGIAQIKAHQAAEQALQKDSTAQRDSKKK